MSSFWHFSTGRHKRIHWIQHLKMHKHYISANQNAKSKYIHSKYLYLTLFSTYLLLTHMTVHTTCRIFFLWLNLVWLNISCVVEFQRWLVIKIKLFGQESTQSRGSFLKKKSFDELQFVKKCQNCIFKVNFQCQKSTEFIQKKIHLRISI